MHPVAQRELEENREAIAAICRRYDVVRLWIFGSATTVEFDPMRSDFDFLAEYGERPKGMSAIEWIIGLPRDLARSVGREVDVVDWQAAKNEFFRRSAERSRLEVYAR